jgi:6-methylsalicylate decarboxylase
VPFLVNRVTRTGERIGKPGWLDSLRRLYYDTAGSANLAAFGPLLQLVTSKQVIFGTDFPFLAAPTVKTTIADLHTLGLSVEELRDIETTNARSLFRRFAS